MPCFSPIASSLLINSSREISVFEDLHSDNKWRASSSQSLKELSVIRFRLSLWKKQSRRFLKAIWIFDGKAFFI